jgi:hypothetical protein
MATLTGKGVKDCKGVSSKGGIVGNAMPKDPRANLFPRNTSSPVLLSEDVQTPTKSLVDSVDSLQRYRKHIATIKNSTRYQRFVALKKSQRESLKQGSLTQNNKDLSSPSKTSSKVPELPSQNAMSQTLPKTIVDMILESALESSQNLLEKNVQSQIKSPTNGILTSIGLSEDPSLEFPHVGSEDRLSPIQRLAKGERHVKKQTMNFIRAAGLMTRSTPRMAVNAISAARTPRMSAAGVSTPGITSRVTWWDDNENMNKSFTLKTDESCAMSYETSYSYEDLLKLGWCSAPFCEGMILDDDSTYNYSYPNDASLDSDDTLDDELQFNIKLIERYKEKMFGWLKNVEKP